MSDQLKKNLTRQSIWIRTLYMIVFILIYGVMKVLVAAVVIFQLLSNLIAAKSNLQLVSFSNNLAIYIYQILQFLMFNSDEKPFPFGEWPEQENNKTPAKRKGRSTKSKKTQTPKEGDEPKADPTKPEG